MTCSAYIFTITFAFDSQEVGGRAVGELHDMLEYGPHLLSGSGRDATPDEVASFAGRKEFWALLHPEPCWCPECKTGVQPECVTHDERHDERCGGCGGAVVPNGGAQVLSEAK